jgi:hypothetical protein
MDIIVDQDYQINGQHSYYYKCWGNALVAIPPSPFASSNLDRRRGVASLNLPSQDDTGEGFA